MFSLKRKIFSLVLLTLFLISNSLANNFVYSSIPLPSYLRKELERQIPVVCESENCSEILPKVMDALGYEAIWMEKENRLVVKRKTLIKDVIIEGLPEEFKNKAQLIKNFLLGQKFSPSIVENAKFLLLFKLRDNGYPDATIDVKVEDTLNGYIVKFKINKGKVYLIKDVKVEANDKKIAENVKKFFYGFIGKQYKKLELEKVIEKIRRKYVNRGYFNFDIEYKIRKNDSLVYVDILIDTGEKYVIVFEGNKHFSADELLKLLTFKRDEAFDQFEIEKSKENIEKFYKDRGFPYIKVSVKQIYLKDYVKVVFVVDEGHFVKIENLVVEFSAAKLASDIKKEIKKKLNSLIHKPFSESKIEKLKEEIETLLYNQGYLKRQVTFSLSEDTLIFKIVVGKKYVLKQIVFPDDFPKRNIPLINSLPLPFTSQVETEILLKVSDYYDSKGFLDAKITLKKKKVIRKNTVEIMIFVKVRKGKRYKVGFFIVTDLKRTELSALESIFVIRPLQTYSRKSVIEQYSLFSDTSLFSMINLKEIKVSSTVSPIFSLKEMPLLKGKGFIGYSTDSGAVGKLSAKMTSPFGKGISIFGSFEYRQSEGSTALLQIGKSGILARRNRGYLTFIRKIELFEDFDVTRHKTKVYIVRKQGSLRQRYGIELSKDIVDYSENKTSQKFYKNTLFVDSIVDKRDSKVNPKNGYKFEINLSYTGGFLKGDTNYFKSEFKFIRLRRLSKYAVGNLVFAFRGGVGYIHPFTSDGVPIQDRFYLGGAESIRGYRYGIISPVDSSGNYIGGDFYTLLSWELRYTIKKQYQFSLFYDRGNVFLSPEDFTFNDWYSSIGVGFRYITPVGPLRIDYGYKLKRIEGEGPGRFHISFGFPF